jgi:hypothetical protein
MKIRLDEPKFISTGAPVWLWFSIAAVILALIGNIISLSVKSIYAGLTPVFFPQALAQDIANLVIVAPIWLILVVLTLRGSLRAYLSWLGVLSFTVYNYVIYTFSIPFGSLFLLWVAVFGISLYALIGGIAAVHHDVVKSRFTSTRAIKVVAWFLIIAAILFTFLWLSEDLPALLSGIRPQSLADMALPTNPVHILDLAFFLPGILLTGVLLLKGKPLAYTLAPSAIIFLILTGIPILITPVVQSMRGEAAAWSVVGPIGTLTVLSIGLLGWLLSTMQPSPREGIKREMNLIHKYRT